MSRGGIIAGAAPAQGPVLTVLAQGGRAPERRHDGPGAHGARAGSRRGRGFGRAERPRSAALLGHAGGAQRDAVGPAAGRRRLGLAGDTCIPGIAGYGCAARCRRRCAAAVCGKCEDREPGGAARGAAVACAGDLLVIGAGQRNGANGHLRVNCESVICRYTQSRKAPCHEPLRVVQCSSSDRYAFSVLTIHPDKECCHVGFSQQIARSIGN